MNLPFRNAGFVSVLVFVVACGSGSSGPTTPNSILSDDPATPGVAEFNPPENSASLVSALTTRYDSANSFDVWACAIDGTSNAVIGLAMPKVDTLSTGLLGIEYDFSNGGQSEFMWAAESNSQIRATYTGTGQETLSSNIDFATSDYFSFTNTNQININCQRMRDADVFGTTSVQVSPRPDNPMPIGTDGPPSGSPNPAGDNLQMVNEPQGFRSLYGFLSYRFIGGLFTLGDDMVALFDDGTQTDDLATVFNDGVAVSRAQNPDDWGRYRFDSAGNLELSDNDNPNDFSEAISDFVVSGGATNQRLEGCFNSVGSAPLEFDGFVDLRVSKFCFDTQGRFTHDSTYAASGIDLTLASSRDDTGRYRIDGNAIRLEYVNGANLTGSFGYLLEDRSSISINGRRYQN